ncbi:MAG: SDR family oxidoreductase [Gammaproteobacteria bacterium]|jgi:NAD(P)-dependent dehydrogenase (short-subunit alcohol dehydrogenase family)
MSKTYLLVGATSGIGQQVAARLLEQEAIVHALGRRADQGQSPRGLVVHPSCDVLLEEPAFPEIDGPIDGLAYFPGTITLRPFNLLRRRDLLHDLELNYLGAVRTLQRYLGQLKKAPSAAVVLMSTVAVQTGIPFHASIAGAKGAIEGLTRALAAELAPKIRVNAVAPSLTDTPLAQPLLNQAAKQEAAAKRHPLQRVGGVDDIASAVYFLLTGQSSWITGQVLPVDGGLSRIRLLS